MGVTRQSLIKLWLADKLGSRLRPLEDRFVPGKDRV